MAKEVIMPKFGFTQESAQIVRWLKRAGDVVEQGDPIAEVTTDKVNMEVEAPISGVLDGLRFAEGDTVPVTHIIAYIRAANETLPGASAAPAPAEPRLTPLAAKLAGDLGVDVRAVSGTGPGGRITKADVTAYAGKVRATPAARKTARDLNIPLTTVTGSGPQGRIQAVDVRAAHAAPVAVAAAGLEPAVTKPAVTEPARAETATPALPGRHVPFSAMRRTIASRLQASFNTAPHIFFEAAIDVTAAESLRARANANPPAGQRLSLTAILGKVCAWALRQHPQVNSLVYDESIFQADTVNLGVAVALEDGLIVPVVREAHAKGLWQLNREIADLAERARSNRLRPADVADGTFSLSNLGMFGVDKFTAIINPPQAAILAVSRVRPHYVPDETGQPVWRPMLTVTLSADHRAIDGAVAARFLADVRAGLENPERLLF